MFGMDYTDADNHTILIHQIKSIWYKLNPKHDTQQWLIMIQFSKQKKKLISSQNKKAKWKELTEETKTRPFESDEKFQQIIVIMKKKYFLSFVFVILGQTIHLI